MRKLMVAAIILLIIAGGIYVEQSLVSDICNEMIMLLEESAKKEFSDLEQVEKRWSRSEKCLEILTPHDDTDQINISIANLKGYAAEGELSSARVVTEQMKAQFNEIRKKIKPEYINIF